MDNLVPSSLIRGISPPLTKRRKISETPDPIENKRQINSPSSSKPSLAAIEAGRAKVEDHLSYFKARLSEACRPSPEELPRLSIQKFANLYESNEHEHGHHFVVHQHNHPRAGVHYDLRLQFSKTSSISFALPKGLPGNPNSRSLGRMAIETRVHNFWNHLIESASYKTGSLLIWDTGTYTILPRKIIATDPQTTDYSSDSEAGPNQRPSRNRETTRQNEKLIEAFQTRYIRLRLHGTRLPKNYTVTLRLPSNDIQKRPARRRKRKISQPRTDHFTDSEPETDSASTPQNKTNSEEENLDTDDDEDYETRLNNAYPGSMNSIGSIHQRKWFLMLDRKSSGFVPGASGVWIRDGEAGFEPFYVRGRDFERSIVTGRLAKEVESDEGLEGFVGRAGWVSILN